MSNLSCGTHVAEPSANKDCRKLLNQFCRFLPKLKLPISADAKLPLTARPAAGRLPDTAGHRAAVVVNRIHRGNIADSVRCHQSERRWLLDGLTPIGVPLPYIHSPTWTELPSTFMTTNNKPAKNCLLAGNDYYQYFVKK